MSEHNEGKVSPLQEGGSKNKNPESLAETSSEFSAAENALIDCARWVFLSNRIVAYFPFSTRLSLTGRKYLNFHLPTLGLVQNLLYILLAAGYISYHFYQQPNPGDTHMEKLDYILILLWDMTVAVSVIGYRIFGLVHLPKVGQFWKGLVELVAQITALSSEKETEVKLSSLRRWTLKWMIAISLLGLSDCCSVFYNFGYIEKKDWLTQLVYTYVESVNCMHSSNATMLIFLIKVITYGFTVCKRRADELILSGNLDGVWKMPRNIYMEDGDSKNHLMQASGLLTVSQILDLVEKLESCVESFNQVFKVSLFLDAVLGFWQVMFALYFLSTIDIVVHAVIMAVPIVIYSSCLVALCVASSDLTKECMGMLSSFQKLPCSILSADESFQIQMLQSRLSSSPPGIQVGQLFQIRECLLSSALNTLATYFIVLVQMRQVATSKDKKEG